MDSAESNLPNQDTSSNKNFVSYNNCGILSQFQNSDDNVISSLVTSQNFGQQEAISETDFNKQKHPLFHVLVNLFEKCEYATRYSDLADEDAYNIDPESIATFLENSSHTSIFTDDPILDELMIKCLQELRIHLVELKKVQELCKIFNTRYINSIRSRIVSEDLLSEHCEEKSSNLLPSPSTTFLSPNLTAVPFDQSSSGVVNSQPCYPVITPQQSSNQLVDNIPSSTSSGADSAQALSLQNQNQTVLVQQQNQGVSITPLFNQNQFIQQSQSQTVYQIVQTPQGIIAQPIQLQTTPQFILTQNPTGGSSISSNNQNIVAIPLSQPQNLQPNNFSSSNHNSPSDSKKNKRGILSRIATDILKTWLFQHIIHPYPSEEEKRQLAQQANLTLLQVNNWFINARRRILLPLLQNSQTLEALRSKKPRSSNSYVKSSKVWWETMTQKEFEKNGGLDLNDSMNKNGKDSDNESSTSCNENNFDSIMSSITTSLKDNCTNVSRKSVITSHNFTNSLDKSISDKDLFESIPSIMTSSQDPTSVTPFTRESVFAGANKTSSPNHNSDTSVLKNAFNSYNNHTGKIISNKS